MSISCKQIHAEFSSYKKHLELLCDLDISTPEKLREAKILYTKRHTLYEKLFLMIYPYENIGVWKHFENKSLLAIIPDHLKAKIKQIVPHPNGVIISYHTDPMIDSEFNKIKEDHPNAIPYRIKETDEPTFAKKTTIFFCPKDVIIEEYESQTYSDIAPEWTTFYDRFFGIEKRQPIHLQPNLDLKYFAIASRYGLMILDTILTNDKTNKVKYQLIKSTKKSIELKPTEIFFQTHLILAHPTGEVLSFFNGRYHLNQTALHDQNLPSQSFDKTIFAHPEGIVVLRNNGLFINDRDRIFTGSIEWAKKHPQGVLIKSGDKIILNGTRTLYVGEIKEEQVFEHPFGVFILHDTGELRYYENNKFDDES